MNLQESKQRSEEVLEISKRILDFLKSKKETQEDHKQ